jgi:hypothetical protein
MKFGRRRPAPDAFKLHFRDYREKAIVIPSPPSSDSYSAAAADAIAQMYGNSEFGCCVVSGVEHIEGVFTGNSNPPPVIFTQLQTLAFYAYFQGYTGDPTDLVAIEAYLANNDNGCDEVTVLNYWQQTGAPGAHKIAGWLAVDATNQDEYTSALWLFENLMFGIELPDEWVNPMPSGSGFIWDAAGPPNPNNGHCFVGVGYNPQGVVISTWGMTGLVTHEAVKQYAIESAGGALYVALSEEIISKAMLKSPNGFDWAQLIADFDAMGGNIPEPNPSPTPGPGPAPVPNPPTMSKHEYAKLVEMALHADVHNPAMDLAAMMADIRSIGK